MDIIDVDGESIPEHIPISQIPEDAHHSRIDIGVGDDVVDIHTGSPLMPYRLPDDNPGGDFPGGGGGPNNNRHYENNENNNPNNIHFHFNPYEKRE